MTLILSSFPAFLFHPQQLPFSSIFPSSFQSNFFTHLFFLPSFLPHFLPTILFLPLFFSSTLHSVLLSLFAFFFQSFIPSLFGCFDDYSYQRKRFAARFLGLVTIIWNLSGLLLTAKDFNSIKCICDLSVHEQKPFFIFRIQL